MLNECPVRRCECEDTCLLQEAVDDAVEAEREACATIADQFAAVTAALDGGAERSSIAAGMANIAAAIRARSTASN